MGALRRSAGSQPEEEIRGEASHIRRSPRVDHAPRKKRLLERPKLL